MSHDEKPRQPKISLRLIVEKNSSKQIASPHRQQNSRTPEFDRTTTSMFASPRITPTDWKLRYDNLQYEHQLELERLRLHYEHQLREKVTGTNKIRCENFQVFSFHSFLFRNSNSIETRS